MAEKLRKRYKDFKEGFIHGLGWSFGVSVGFVIVSTIFVLLLRISGGLPLTGSVIADVVMATQESLSRRSIISP